MGKGPLSIKAFFGHFKRLSNIKKIGLMSFLFPIELKLRHSPTFRFSLITYHLKWFKYSSQAALSIKNTTT